MPPDLTSLVTHTLIGAGILFVIAYIGNRITFANRLINALVTALVFAAVFSAFIFAVDTAVQPVELSGAHRRTWLDLIATSAALVFVIDLVANLLSFSNRLQSAGVTSAIFAVFFPILIYMTQTAT